MRSGLELSLPLRVGTGGEGQGGLVVTRPYEIVELISARSIATRVEELARDIRVAFRETDKLIMVGLLRGSFVLIADLVRELDMNVEVDFLEVSSYGNEMTSSHEVRILKDLRGEIEGEDVLVVEDIVDTGYTLNHVVRFLQARNPRRLETIALLDKPSRREVEICATWIGFEIPDEFVVGYGIDYAQRNRNLPYIGRVCLGDSDGRASAAVEKS
ncbi:MAG: hypoxanthine phosphoribosyltransferase [Boseongicola sp. SB0676_bin_33]|uniref:Hypoxanthine phosphoribosyltransferase n=1 Tax=Boseongicola sp. SB0664_bin_43 TaxID=2604844 RepID=A0A6B0Y118_9RHOB|nr:hypoxanthine phosphoribosyltransferase [Boseongicola sp. SB0664_bin_43]MYF90290.1 hypoxanthine phosphoribosyltransferase [Boseongicola sp. SB0676_bin_33]